MSKLFKSLVLVMFLGGLVPLQALACPGHKDGHCKENCDQASGECYCDAPSPA